MEYFDFTPTDGTWHIEGFPDAVKLIRIEGSKARALAHLMLHKVDLDFALQSLDGMASQLKDGIDLNDLPAALGNEIERISKMNSFRDELSQFLKDYGLPSLTRNRPDGWPQFLHLYTQVVEDIPLVVTSAPTRKRKRKQATTNSGRKHIAKVTVHCESAEGTHMGHMIYKVIWRIFDENGESGEIEIFNSFSTTEE